MRKPALVGIVSLAVTLFALPAWAASIYVSKSGSDATGDGTLEKPYVTVQKGIRVAVAGDEVIVMPGTYAENISFLGKAITIRSFQPDNQAFVTFTVIDGGRRTSVVKFTKKEKATSVLKGLTITNGGGTLGAGIRCFGSSPTIEGNIIAGNSCLDIPRTSYGGGIYCRSASPVISHNTIQANGAVYGGGIAFTGKSTATVSDNTIKSNLALLSGGGISLKASSPAINTNVLEKNTAYYGYGGGAWCDAKSSPAFSGNTVKTNTAKRGAGLAVWRRSKPAITGNTITDNAATDAGGGIAVTASSPTISGNTLRGNSVLDGDGGAIWCTSKSSVAIDGNTIMSNKAHGGAGIALDAASSATITGNRINGNMTRVWGGAGVYLRLKCKATIDNNIICGNWSCDGGSEGGAGLLVNDHSTATITNCTVAQNRADSNGGGGIAVSFSAVVKIASSIFRLNTAPKGAQIAIWQDAASADVSASNVQGGQAQVYNDLGVLTWGADNTDEAPGFAALGSWNDNATPSDVSDDYWEDGDYTVAP